MTFKVLPTLQKRIKRIQDHVSENPDHKVTRWEINYMRDLQEKGIKFGSDAQNIVLGRIEKRVFGKSED